MRVSLDVYCCIYLVITIVNAKVLVALISGRRRYFGLPSIAGVYILVKKIYLMHVQCSSQVSRTLKVPDHLLKMDTVHYYEALISSSLAHEFVAM